MQNTSTIMMSHRLYDNIVKINYNVIDRLYLNVCNDVHTLFIVHVGHYNYNNIIS